VMCITSALTEAASYQKTDGTIVDPIVTWVGSPHFHSTGNLQPSAKLIDAVLNSAVLPDAASANLTNTNLNKENLCNLI